jgi:peptidyl-prolyl cis-trans isomerase C
VRPRRRARVVAVAAGLAVAGVLGTLAVDRDGALPGDAAFVVGGDVVTEGWFRRQLAVVEALDGAGPPAADPQRDRYERDVAHAAVVGLVLGAESRRRGLVVSDADVDRARAAHRPGGAVVAEGDLRAELRRRLAVDALRAQVVAGVPAVTDGELRRAYLERPPLSAERRRLLNIVVESRERAEEVLAQAQAGADWGWLAVRYSRDDATRDTGGELGEPSADELDEPYAAAAFAAGAGEFFGPVQTRAGWNVGQVVGVQAAVPVPFELVGEQLRARLLAERQAAAWGRFVRGQVAAVAVEYAPRYRPVDPSAAPEPPPVAATGG